MANFTLRTHTNTTNCFTHGRIFQTPNLFHQQSHLLQLMPSKTHLKVRLLSGFKEGEEVSLDKRVSGSVVTRVKTDDEVDQLVSVTAASPEGQFDHGRSEKDEGFGWKWPPWKNLPQRYKLIGTTSLAFVICNMDKVLQFPHFFLFYVLYLYGLYSVGFSVHVFSVFLMLFIHSFIEESLSGFSGVSGFLFVVGHFGGLAMYVYCLKIGSWVGCCVAEWL